MKINGPVEGKIVIKALDIDKSAAETQAVDFAFNLRCVWSIMLRVIALLSCKNNVLHCMYCNKNLSCVATPIKAMSNGAGQCFWREIHKMAARATRFFASELMPCGRVRTVVKPEFSS